jgi:hypothetical protein
VSESPEDQRIGRLVDMARQAAANGHTGTATFYYEAVFVCSKDLQTPVQRLACGEACAWKAESARLEGMLGTAADWYWRALIADPLADELRTLYLDAVKRSQDDMAKHVRKLEEVMK